MKITQLRKLLLASVMTASVAGYAGAASAYDYLTEGHDAARTGWIKEETLLTKANLGKVKLLWRTQLPAIPRQYHNLHGPLIIERVQTPQGIKEVAIVAGVSDQLWGIDAKTGQVLWSKEFDYTNTNGVRPGGQGRLCPGGQTAQPAVEKMANGSYKVWALSHDGRLWQVDPATGANLAPPVKFTAGNGKVYSLNIHNGYVYTSTAQGCGGNASQFLAYNTRDQRSSAFFPSGGGMWGRRGVAVDSQGTAWMGTGDQDYRPATGDFGNVVIGVRPNQSGLIDLMGVHAGYNANWLWKRDMDINVSPMIITYRGKEMMVHTNKDCRVHLVDLAAVRAAGSKGLRQTLDTSNLVCNDRQLWDEKGVWGSLTGAQDSTGKQWVFLPFWGEKSVEFNPPIINTPRVPGANVADNQLSRHGGVGAFTVDATPAGGYQLTPRWLSQDMDMAEEGIFANDIFWVFASGVNARQQGREIRWDDRTTPFGSPLDMGNRAVIYALDAQTGRTLWSSGDTIQTWNHFSSISMANGRVYLGTFDGVMYAFGIDE